MLNLLEAMAAVESGGDPHARSTRNGNPGNINWGAFARQHGATRIEIIPPGYNERARFGYWPNIGPTDGSVANTGYGAMKALLKIPGILIQIPATATVPSYRKLTSGYAGSTIREMLNKYAPPEDNNVTSAYESRVCKLVGCQPTTIIDELIAAL